MAGEHAWNPASQKLCNSPLRQFHAIFFSYLMSNTCCCIKMVHHVESLNHSILLRIHFRWLEWDSIIIKHCNSRNYTLRWINFFCHSLNFLCEKTINEWFINYAMLCHCKNLGNMLKMNKEYWFTLQYCQILLETTTLLFFSLSNINDNICSLILDATLVYNKQFLFYNFLYLFFFLFLMKIYHLQFFIMIESVELAIFYF